MVKINKFSVLTAILTAFIFAGTSFAEEYYTWDTLEPDTIGSAWMLKTFIDNDAVFFFVKKDESPSRGIPFDIPLSKYRRYPTMSATESVLKFNGIKDEKAMKIAKSMNEIELNYWSASKSELTQKIENDIRQLLEDQKDPQKALEKGIDYLNQVYASL